ncbi:MAG: AmmeMemoRadiSam system protein B [Bacteroidia bacterium]|nr:MAG: AmmeMemoRadiSam system protein B [Bacteroidia bacterium]
MEDAKIRKPGVAGVFYPGSPEKIIGMIESALERERVMIKDREPGIHVYGGVVPHAGMVYCAAQTVHLFEYIRQSGQKPDTVVLVHPNHTGYGPDVSIDGFTHWETPLGLVPVDREFADKLDLKVSDEAQDGEHSAEVIVPYLQYFIGEDTRIVSVNMLSQSHKKALITAKKVYDVAKGLNRKILVLASSDFSHFLSPEDSVVLDDRVLKSIFKKDAPGVEEEVRQHQVSVCGYGPIMVMMEYAGLINSEYAVHMLRRGHSGEVSPSRKVVNYISLLFSEKSI